MIESEAIEYLKKFANCVGYEFFQKGDKPSVVIVGESHGYERPEKIELGQLEKLIEKLKPEYVLIETLHALCYDPKRDCIKFRKDATTDERDLEQLRGFEENEANYYKQISKKYNIKLIGCDLSLGELNRLPEDLCINTWGLDPLTVDDPRIDDAREIKMGEIVIDYSIKHSTPFIAVIGHCHARSDSKTREELNGNIDYICIWDEGVVKKKRKEKKKI